MSCQQVVDGLTKRGHEARVLTSRYRAGQTAGQPKNIVRSFYLEMDLDSRLNSVTFFFFRKRRARYNLSVLEAEINHFRPDIIVICGMWNLNRSLAAYVERRYPGHVVYRFADYWPTLPSQYQVYWHAKGRQWFSRMAKHLISKLALMVLSRDTPPPPLRFEHAYCVSSKLDIRFSRLVYP